VTAVITCRGCGQEITPTFREGQPTLWEDKTGVTVCVKAPLEGIGRGTRPDYVFHEPMPAGLLGGPDG